MFNAKLGNTTKGLSNHKYNNMSIIGTQGLIQDAHITCRRYCKKMIYWYQQKVKNKNSKRRPYGVSKLKDMVQNAMDGINYSYMLVKKRNNYGKYYRHKKK